MSVAAERRAWTREKRRLGGIGEPGGGLSPGGLFGSLSLHLLVAMLILLGLPSLITPPPEPPVLVPVDLVELGDKTMSPAHSQTATVPQEKAPETSKLTPPNPVPVPLTPPPAPPVKSTQPAAGPLDPLASLSLQGTPEPPKIIPRLKPNPPPAAVKSKKPPPPVEDLAATLQSLTLQQQLQARTPPSPSQQDGTGASNVTAGNSDAALGPMAMYSAKDFIRVQIARHWYLDRNTIGSGAFTVSIHLLLTADGRVSEATILDNMSFSSSPAYRAAAISLRGAALLSSPLTMPPGHYAEVRDIVLTFSPKEVLQ
jgi:hypothetical protein